MATPTEKPGEVKKTKSFFARKNKNKEKKPEGQTRERKGTNPGPVVPEGAPGDLGPRFEAFMEEKCFKDEVREKMRALPDQMKWTLLLQEKTQAAMHSKTKEDDPQYWVDYLKKTDQVTEEQLNKLRVILSTSGKSMLEPFLKGEGLSALLAVVSDPKKSKKTPGALHCVKAVMNNSLGLDVILTTADIIDQIALVLSHGSDELKIEALDILTVLSWVSAKGHKAVVQALQSSVFKIPRFKWLIDMMNRNENFEVKTRVLTLINAIINATDALEERVVTRRMFLDLNLNGAVETLLSLMDDKRGKNQNSEVFGKTQAQCDLFQEEMQNDQKETACGNLDMSDIDAVFGVIKKFTADDGFGGHFLKILQHLLAIPGRNDGEQFWQNIENITREAVGSTEGESGLSPTLKYEDLKALIEKRDTEERGGGGGSDAIIEQQRKEIHKMKMENAHLQDQLKGKGGVTVTGEAGEEIKQLREEIEKLKAQVASGGGGGGSSEAPPVDGSAPAAPPMDDSAPAPPPMDDGAPPPPDMDGGPPMAPPMDGDGPPPAPGMDSPVDTGPALPKKKIIKPKQKLKPFHWVVVQPREVLTTCWATMSDDKVMSALDTNELESLFAAAKKEGSTPGKGPEMKSPVKKKEVVELIESKRAYNINIALARFRMSHEEIKDALLAMDEKVMTEEKLSALIKCAPTQDELDTVTSYEGDLSVLGNTELFFRTIALVPRVEKRLQVFLFKERFPIIVSETEGMLLVCELAIEALRNSKGLLQILELVLATGNYLNGSTPKGGAYGFKMDTLFKLGNTKSADGTTLLHFLVKTVQAKFAKAQEFKTDLRMLPDASRVESSYLKGEIGKIAGQVRLVANEVKAVAATAADRFVPVMTGFLENAQKKSDELTKRLEAVETKGAELTKFYGEEPERKKLEEMFSLFNGFLAEYQQAEEHIKKQQAAAERDARREKEKKDKAAAKAASGQAEEEVAEEVSEEPALPTDQKEGGQVDAVMKQLGTTDAGDIMKAIRQRRKLKKKPGKPVAPRASIAPGGPLNTPKGPPPTRSPLKSVSASPGSTTPIISTTTLGSSPPPPASPARSRMSVTTLPTTPIAPRTSTAVPPIGIGRGTAPPGQTSATPSDPPRTGGPPSVPPPTTSTPSDPPARTGGPPTGPPPGTGGPPSGPPGTGGLPPTTPVGRGGPPKGPPPSHLGPPIGRGGPPSTPPTRLSTAGPGTAPPIPARPSIVKKT